MNDFFEESREQSRVKAAIVSKYFDAWANVIMAVQDRNQSPIQQKLAYIDLFAGPGRYMDGTHSTPIKILEKTLNNERLRQRLVTIFNDKDMENTNSLKQAIQAIPGINLLKYQPIVQTQEVGENIVKLFEEMKLVPTLFFVDPWGYKGLSLRLVNSVLKDWGCDCIFFFNYNRINMGLNNDAVRIHMDALFGRERAIALRQRIEGNPVIDRELLIIEELCRALKEMGPRFVLPFRFKDERGSRTSHHLIFVSKDFKGYEIMKDIMARECSSETQGVPCFEYNPVDSGQREYVQLLLQLSSPLDDLGQMLLKFFSGKTITMHEIYEEHNVDRPYIKKNYKQILMQLEKEGKIKVAKHKAGTFGDSVVVNFPEVV